LNSKKIEEIISILKKEFPGQQALPGRANPLDILVATMLSQNTTDKTSYIAFKNLKKDIGTWEEVMNASPAKVKKAIRVCGLTNQKSASLRALLKGLFKKYGGLSLNFMRKKSNEDIYEELLQFKGIGVKTISCMLAFSLERDVFPVDTHVHRVTNRLGIAHASTPLKTFEQMKDKIPEGKKYLFHALLIKFGRKICRSAAPICGRCPLYDLCEFPEKEYFAMNNNSEPKENNFIILEHV
jgi:endonuclease-3